MTNNNELTLEEAWKLFSPSLSDFQNKLKEYSISTPKSGKFKKNLLEKYFKPLPASSGVGNIIAISNQKGGEGKTTLSLCLAESFSQMGKTLLVDWDPQANSTTNFVREAESTIWDAIPYKGKKSIPIREILVEVTPTLHLAPSSLELANMTTPFEMDDFELLKDALLPIRSSYDTIIIDCPPSLGLILENALISADYILIPIQTRAFSVQGISDLDSTIKKIQKKANPRLKLLGAVLNQYEGQKALAGLAENIKKYFPVFETVIHRRESIPQAQAKMSLLSTYDAKAFKPFQKLAKEIQEKINVQENRV